MESLKVFMTRPDYPDEAVQLLREKFEVEFSNNDDTISRDDLLRGVKGKHALFCCSSDRIDKEVIDSAGDQIKVIATMSVGYEHIDVQECHKRSIVVCNSPNALTVSAVAEMTLCMMISIGRKYSTATQIIKRGEWTDKWRPHWFAGRGLTNSVVGIVGMGRIGQAVLKRVLAFDVAKVVYFDVFHPVKQAEELGAEYLPFEELLSVSDYVVATCNLTDHSRGMFNAKAFSLMKSSAYFINTSRGGVVEQDDLYDALKRKVIKGAALDVMYPEPLPKDHKLVQLDNIELLPHIAAAEERAVNYLGVLTAENIAAVLEGKQPLTPVK